MQALNDFQKLLGDVNWLRPSIGLTTEQLLPLFNILRGDPDPTSPRVLTPEAEDALALIDQALSQQQILRVSPNQPFSLLILDTPYLPTGLLWQEGPLEWLHLPSQRRKVIYPYHQAIATVIQKGRSRALELFGRSHFILSFPSERT